MLRLTLILCIAIYACLVIFSDPAVVSVEEETVAPTPEAPEMQAALREEGGRTTLVTEDGRVLEISDVIVPSDGQERRAADAPAADAVAEDTAEVGPSSDAAETGAQRPVVEVTGTRVNLRSGPSTDTEILGALVQGTQAEVLATLADGWAQIRVIDTGVEGYMADRFLAAVN